VPLTARSPRRPRGLLRADLVLLHPPALYDFRRHDTLFGPVSDAVPSTPVFEMYPLGFTSLGARLEREGYNVRIVNLAYRMLRDPGFDVPAVLSRLDPVAFGIDLHWLVHAHGALAVAALVKHLHPETPVIIGGVSATYFHRELIAHPQVDLVLRGDSTEEPMVALLRALCSGSALHEVPGLTWKHGRRVVVNPPPPVPSDLHDVRLPDYGYVIRSVLRHRSLADVVPYGDWPRYPMTGLLTSRGCVYDCAICGGGASAGQRLSHRARPAFRSADGLVADIRDAQALSRGPIILLNDIRMAGAKHTRRFFELLRTAGIRNELVFELFSPPGRQFLSAAAEAVPRFSLQLSLESQRQELRRRFGKFVASNAAIERALETALQLGVNRVDLFFMIGLPGQTYRDAVGCVDYCRHLLERFAGDGRLQFFVAPLTPFLDPASPAFERPADHGYRLRWRTLEEHRQALTAPTWKQVLNYATDAMTADEIVAATYDSYDRLADLKREWRRIDAAACERVHAQTRDARSIIAAVDRALAHPDIAERERLLAQARDRIRGLRNQKSAAADELKWTVHGSLAAPWRTAGLVARQLCQEARRLVTRRLPLLMRARRIRGPGRATPERQRRDGDTPDVLASHPAPVDPRYGATA